MIGNIVPLWGKIPCDYLIVGEGPGRTESETGLPFSGVSGAELDWVYLKRAARMRREDFAITNIVKYRTDEKDSDPTEEDILRDEPLLIQEISLVNPKIIVAVGRIATQWCMRQNEVDMERLHGVPIVCPRYPDKTLISVYHPAAGLHQPERYYTQIFWDFEQVGRLVRGEIGVVDTKPVPVIRSGNVGEIPPSEPVAVDTEGTVEVPWGMSWATDPLVGSVVHSGTISLSRMHVEGHNILHDAPVFRALGTEIDLSKADDSMLLAYLLPWLPRRLKALYFKLCGGEQLEYEEVIAEPQERISKEYLQTVLQKVCPECKGARVVKVPYKRAKGFKSVKCHICKGDGTGWPLPRPQLLLDTSGAGRQYTPRSIGRSVSQILERGTKLREGWENIPSEVRNAPESELGRLREATLADVHYSTAEQYAGVDACATKAVCNVLKPMVRKEGLWNVYEIDKGILPIIDRMHTNGILIDRDHFKKLEVQFEEEQKRIQDELCRVAGQSINPVSPLQVSALLYSKLGAKGRGSGASTDEKTLETLKIKYKSEEQIVRCIDLITDYRELNKLLGTYVRTLPLAADSNGRIHTRFLLHITASGRLASRDPNLQNQPVRTERGHLIRAGFIPRRGCRLASVDLDQIELRVAAHLSNDDNMIATFKEGRDIHRTTAGLIYGKPIDAVTTQERVAAKTINFGILYGMSHKRLFKELNLLGIQTTQDQCVDYLNKWFAAYPGVRDYMDTCHAQAKSRGYVECLFGRRRYVQGVWSVVEKVREESLRWAGNHGIQATSAGIMKLWLKAIWDSVLPKIQPLGYCEPLLTVHDEIIMEVDSDIAVLAGTFVQQSAASVIELSVPIAAKFSVGDTWAALK